MITYKEGNFRFNYRIVGVCIRDGDVLLHRNVADDYWTLPGGRAELMEFSPETLRREMQEELDVHVNVGRLLWVAENFFDLESDVWHELSLYYLMSFPEQHKFFDSPEFRGIEDNGRLIFRWFPIAGLKETSLFPTFLRDSLQSIQTHPAHILHRDTEKID